MKSIYKSIMCVAAGLSMLSSCENFDSINTNPNGVTPETVDPQYILAPILIKGSMCVETYHRIHNNYYDLQAQYFSNEKYDTNINRCLNDYTEDYYMNTTYFWGWIAGLNEIIRITKDDPSRLNLKSIARIYRVYLYTICTDLLGDVPYFKAADGSGEAAPYDRQKDIYYDMVKELTEASAAIGTPGAGTVESKFDLIFKGDLSRWKAFANSMHLRLAMRMTEADPQKAEAETKAAVKADGGFITTDVTIPRGDGLTPATWQMDWGWYYSGVGYMYGGRLAMSKSMEKILTNLGGIEFPMKDYYDPDHIPEYVDPRGPIYFNVTNEINGAMENYRGRWEGIPAGYTKAVALEEANAQKNHARLGAFFIRKDQDPDTEDATIYRDHPQTLMYVNEVSFLLAEAAWRGWVTGSAKDFYERGIRESMSVVNIEQNIVDSYLQSTMKNGYGVSVKFDDVDTNRNTQLDKIITQKYIGGFPYNGFEAWNDYRRLGIPTLDPFAMPAEGSVQEKGAMDWKGSLRRVIYPTGETIKNAENYKEAAARYEFGDNTKSRMWWDARKTIKE